jgi:hypothetical protein
LYEKISAALLYIPAGRTNAYGRQVPRLDLTNPHHGPALANRDFTLYRQRYAPRSNISTVKDDFSISFMRQLRLIVSVGRVTQDVAAETDPKAIKQFTVFILFLLPTPV